MLNFVRKLNKVPFDDSTLYIYNNHDYNIIIQKTLNQLGTNIIITANPKDPHALALIVYRNNDVDNVIIKENNKENFIKDIDQLALYAEENPKLNRVIEDINELLDSNALE